MEQSAGSHQLRLLRTLGFVTGKRSGKHIVYGLYDNHVAMLLDKAVYHSEHLAAKSTPQAPLTWWLRPGHLPVEEDCHPGVSGLTGVVGRL